MSKLNAGNSLEIKQEPELSQLEQLNIDSPMAQAKEVEKILLVHLERKMHIDLLALKYARRKEVLEDEEKDRRSERDDSDWEDSLSSPESDDSDWQCPVPLPEDNDSDGENSMSSPEIDDPHRDISVLPPEIRNFQSVDKSPTGIEETRDRAPEPRLSVRTDLLKPVLKDTANSEDTLGAQDCTFLESDGSGSKQNLSNARSKNRLYCNKCCKGGDCAEHGPLVVVESVPIPPDVKDFSRARRTLPKLLTLADSQIPDAGCGVWAREDIPARARFGPYEGQILPPELGGAAYSWMIRKNRKPLHCIDATEPGLSTWLRYVNFARDHDEQNLEAFQLDDKLYYRTTRCIFRDQELLVWYGDGYGRHLGSDAVNSSKEKKYSCSSCFTAFATPLLLKQHRSLCQYTEENQHQETPNDTSDQIAVKDEYNEESLPFQENILISNVKSEYPFHDVCAAQVTDRPEDTRTEMTEDPLEDISVKNPPAEKEDVMSELSEYPLDVVGSEDTRTEMTEDPLEGISVKNPPAEKEDVMSELSEYPLDVVGSEEISNGVGTHEPEDSSNRVGTHEPQDLSNVVGPHEPEDSSNGVGICEPEDSSNGVETNEPEDSSNGVRTHGLEDSSNDVGTHEPGYSSENDSSKESACESSEQSAQLRRSYMVPCPVCKLLTRKSYLKVHILTHSGVKPYVCKSCNTGFTSQNSLEVHKRKNCNVKPFICRHCPRRFAALNLLKFHVLEKHHNVKPYASRPYACTECPKRYNSKKNLGEHIRLHTNENRCVCPYCQKNCYYPRRLKEHFKTHTGEKPYACDKCDKRYAQESSLIVHKKIHSAKRRFVCGECDKVFSRPDHLYSHAKSHGGKPYECPECCMRFSSYSRMKIHKRTHRNNHRFACRICDERFENFRLLNAHLRTHTSVDEYPCPICRKNYKKEYLPIHMKGHSVDRPFKCSHCSQRFMRKHHLANHVKSHSRETPYSCKLCSRRFSLLGSLKVHEMTHGRDRAVQCPQCEKTFLTSISLTRHITIVHMGVKPFVCEEENCDLQFTREMPLADHIRSRHTKEKPFTCYECDRSFHSSQVLREHIRYHNHSSAVEQDSVYSLSE